MHPRTQDEWKEEDQGPAKRRYKVSLIAQPVQNTPTMATLVTLTATAPITMVATTSTQTLQTPTVKTATESIPVTVYNLAKGKYYILHQLERPQPEANPFNFHSNPPPLEDIPTAPIYQVREGNPWPNIMPTSENLFWNQSRLAYSPFLTPTVRASIPAPSVKAEMFEVPPWTAAIPHTILMPKQNIKLRVEKCAWGPNFPICKRKCMARKTGTETDRKASITHKTTSTPNPMTSQTITHKILGQRRNG